MTVKGFSFYGVNDDWVRYGEYLNNAFLMVHKDNESEEVKEYSEKLKIWNTNCDLIYNDLPYSLKETRYASQEEIKDIMEAYTVRPLIFIIKRIWIM